MGISSQRHIAVVLFQLGGPDSLEAVEPFLYNLFRDPDIINFPGAFLARKPLAKFISSRRAKKVSDHYKEIGGKSPIIDLTKAQADALRIELNRSLQADIFVAMRYWHPSTEEVIEKLRARKYDKLILLPLYPQYSRATTYSSLKEWSKQTERMQFISGPAETICCYHNHTLYIEAITDNINTALQRFVGIPQSDIDLVFSAHGIPLSLVNAGDPYKGQIEETVRLVLEKGRWESPYRLCYQSKIGPSEWLKPSLNQTLRDLAGLQRKNLLVIPVAFVTEHIETLYEINIEAREEAEHLGISKFEMMPALNASPKFIRCLSELVLSNV